MSHIEYCNPIRIKSVRSMRDPQITRVDGRYYLTGTLPPYWEGPNPGVGLWSSDDLVNWQDEEMLVDASGIPATAWYKDRFWAPEIHQAKGMFFLTFNCRNAGRRFPHSVGIARARDIRGPYEIVSHDSPLVQRANDAHLFTDNDGRHYVVYASYFFICAQEILLPECRLTGEPWLMIRNNTDGWDTGRFDNSPPWDRVGIEGPYVIRRRGLYYLWYSSWTYGYASGIATAKDLRGDWTKSPANPIIKARAPFGRPGHNAVFPGPDGHDWLCYHADDTKGVESIILDPMWIDDNGEIHTHTPTATPQRVTCARSTLRTPTHTGMCTGGSTPW